MDENTIRPERIPGTSVNRDLGGMRAAEPDRDVDIRRSMIMGRDLDSYGPQHLHATAPLTRALHWGPIWAGLMTSLVTSLLFGALFLGLGFNSAYGLFGGLTSGQVSLGAGAAALIGVFIGGYLTGYVSDMRTRSESLLNGFMVGVMSLAAPIGFSLYSAIGAANTTALAAASRPDVSANLPGDLAVNVQNGLVIAASNAWQVFFVGLLVLGLGTLAGYLGQLTRARAIARPATRDLDRTAY